MLRSKIFKSKALVFGVVAFLLSLILPLGSLAQQVAALEGIVYQQDMKTPVENAVVKIKNIQTNKEYQSGPSDKKGAYKIAGIPEGRYMLGISTKEGDYNFDFEVFVKGGETARLDIGLKKGAMPAVVASLEKKPLAFFTTPIGIAAVVLASGGLVAGGYFIITGEKSTAKR